MSKKEWNEKKELNVKTVTTEILGTIIGALIIAAGTTMFLLPNKLSSGGISGIATITYYLFNAPMGIVILALNIPLFLIAIYKIGKYFFTKAIIGTIALSVFIDLLENLPTLTHDRLLACIYGGIIIGIGTAIIFKMESSTGGSDLITLITKSYKPTLRVAKVITIIDTVVVILNVIFLGEIEIGLYSAIAIYIAGKMVDIVFEGVDFTKLLIIISDKNEEIAKEIGEKVDRGTTGLIGKGMYRKQNKLVLLCAAGRGDISKIKTIIQKIDPHSFIIISNAREVFGLGFKKQEKIV